MRSLLTKAIKVLTTVGLGTVGAADTSLSAPTVITGTPAVLLTSVRPVYPFSEALNDHEGWLMVSYDISAEGQVADITVLDQIGPKAFAEAAIKALKAWRFKPATFQEKPVPQFNNLQSFIFQFTDSPDGIELRRAREIRRLMKLVEAKDDTTARVLIDQLLLQPLNAYEQALLFEQRANLAHYAQRFDDEVYYLERARIGSRLLRSNSNALLLSKLFVAQVRTGKVADALETYQSLITHQSVITNWADFETVHKELNAALASNRPLSTRGEIRQVDWNREPMWTYRLLRRSIEFSEIQGTPRHFQVRCERNMFGDQVVTDKNWTVPDGWGKCILRVSGEPGATFVLTEFAAPAEGK